MNLQEKALALDDAYGAVIGRSVRVRSSDGEWYKGIVVERSIMETHLGSTCTYTVEITDPIEPGERHWIGRDHHVSFQRITHL